MARSRESDPAETTSVRRARDGPIDHPSRQEKVLTDGWNCKKVVVGSNLHTEIFFFFFFLRLDRSAAAGFHEDRINSVPKAVTLTNNPCSLELSSRHTEESMLLLPLLLECQDCRRVHRVSNTRYAETPVRASAALSMTNSIGIDSLKSESRQRALAGSVGL